MVDCWFTSFGTIVAGTLDFFFFILPLAGGAVTSLGVKGSDSVCGFTLDLPLEDDVDCGVTLFGVTTDSLMDFFFLFFRPLAVAVDWETLFCVTLSGDWFFFFFRRPFDGNKVVYCCCCCAKSESCPLPLPSLLPALSG